MNRLKLVILLIFAFSIKLNAQQIEHLCVGEQYTFGPDSTSATIFTSHFIWRAYPSSLVTIDTTLTTNNHQVLIDLNNTGVFKLLVEEIDANGCSGYDSILVEIHDLPNPNIFAIGPTSFCEGDSVRLQVDSIYSSSIWNNGSLTSSILADTTGWHYIEVTDTNGCIGISDSIFTMQHPNPDIDFLINGICEDMPSIFIDLSTIPFDNISDRIWYLGDGSTVHGDSIMHIYNDDGDFLVKLIVISDFGCLDSLSKMISIYNNPIASFEYNPFTASTLQPEINFMTTTSNFISVFWDFDDSTYSIFPNHLHEFEDPGIYDVMLMVADSNQCIDSVMHRITMYYDFVLYMPNSFTPNDDGGNDNFGPKGIRMEKYESYEFTVFNRWGAKVFTTDKVSEQWDGANGLEGTYTWSIIIIDELGAVRKKIGEVMLIK